MAEFSRMNSTSFERLVRALAFEIFGPGGTVYSSGPDGGRDFTIEGKIRGYQDRGWDGYLVIQAKFKEKADTNDDVSWLQGQLGSEQAKFTRAASAPRCPHYYIIATNVSLSGTDGTSKKGSLRTGGHKKISKVLDLWRSAPGIKDYDIWSGDKLIDLLAAKPLVAQTFAAWTTPGDVLTELLTSLRAKQPDFATVVRRAMKTELRKDQYARLKDAGSVDNEEIATSQVFVDLPIDTGRRDRVSRNALDSLIRLSKGSFSDEASERKGNTSHSVDSRIVLMGGPGQGKSTLTTFLIQVFRAVIIQDDPALQRDATIRTIVPGIIARASQEGIDLDIPRRYPVGVSLPRYADAIATSRATASTIPSLLSFLTENLSVTADQPIQREDLRRWLHHYPWIIVLDGLDEVPASGERTAVLDAIKAFESEVAEANGDVLIVVTTRPQGYNQDFDPKDWRHWHLMDLNPTQALRYAEELGKALHRDDTTRRTEVLAALTQASSRPATSRLMVNPLQVTIMHMIVDTGGGVPPGRWNLFNEYYEVLKRREKAKGGEIRRILERNWNWLGPVHQRVGLMLHVESEISGGANSHLSPDQFERLIQDYLCSESLSAADAKVHADELRTLAVDRLVLLSAKEQEKIAFDVRSLQEFMAASAITNNPTVVEERLKLISKASHWRNVFLIASSRCFDDDSFHHLRSSVMNITRELETDSNLNFLKIGAYLALDMFHDGLAVEHPQFRKQLAIHALELLALGPDEFNYKMASLYEPVTSTLIDQNLIAILSQKAVSRESAAAWIMAFMLWDDTCEEVNRLIEFNLPDIASISSFILRSSPPIPSVSMAHSIRNEFLKSNPTEAIFLFQQYFRSESEKFSETENVLRELIPTDGVDMIVDVSSIENGFYSLNIKRIDNTDDAFQIACPSDSPWEILNRFTNFNNSPSKSALAECLEWLAASEDRFQHATRLKSRAAWPIETLISISGDTEALLRVSANVRYGQYGDVDEWRAAEQRWSDHGITEYDYEYVARTSQPFGKDVASVGLPLSRNYIIVRDPKHGALPFQKLLSLVDGLPKSPTKSSLCASIFSLVEELPRAQFNLQTVSTLINFITETDDQSVSMDFLAFFPDEFWESDELVDGLVGEMFRPVLYYGYLDRFELLNKIVEKYISNPRKRGNLLKIVYNGLQSQRQPTDIHKKFSKIDIETYEDDPDDIACVKDIFRFIYKGLEGESTHSSFLYSSENISPILSLELLTREDVDPMRGSQLAMGIIQLLRSRPEESHFYIRGILEKALNRMPSKIHNSFEWERLRLPKEARPKIEGLL